MKPSVATSPTRFLPLLASAIVVALAFVQRGFVTANPDVAWYLTVGEKWLAGATLYVDVLEINPPLAVWLYVPAIWLARIVGARPETALDVIIVVCACASAWLAARALDDRDPARRAWLPPATLAAMLLLPAACFAEREHFAAIFFLPALAVDIRRAKGAAVSAANVVMAALCEAFVVCVKPHFALAVAGAALAAAIARRSPRPLFAPEHLLAAAIFALYVAATFVLHPAFWSDMLPLARLVYLAVRVSPMLMLDGGLPLLVVELLLAGAFVVYRIGNSARAPGVVVAVAAALGFAAAAIVQGKGWPYHFYPALALVVVIFVAIALGAERERARGAVAFACAGLFTIQFWFWFASGLDMRMLHAPLRAAGPNPRVIGLVSDFAVSFPTVRAVDGVWVGRTLGRWVPFYVAGLVAADGFDRALLPAYRRADETDRRQVAADILTGKPDVVLIERAPFDFLAWARKDAELAALLTCFREDGRYRAGDASTQGVDLELWRASAPIEAAGCAPR